MLAKAQGCTKVIAVEIHGRRLSTAKELGATNVINISNEDLIEEVNKITNGKGVSFSVDKIGVSTVM
ncbi:zinc-binding dehydrogenase [Staphylococcus haemolyticus]|uniref:zinc-binding dehydrogenase n=1 Tax=Staphylococcus haemolyticus TaxID=1283 RepID=UPI002174F12C|nr:zinc-binding dehydrogenase [Staphylococcus haemolyticus]